jgi:Fe-S cluster assembly scaffold protein SufB
VSYLEGCTAPAYDSNQLHAAVVELSAGANAEIKYSTVQNWWVVVLLMMHSDCSCLGLCSTTRSDALDDR